MVRYDVEPRSIGLEQRTAFQAIQRDFVRIREMGFDGVVLWYAEDGARIELLDIARSVGLTAAVPDRSMQFYAMTGALPRGVTDVSGLVKAIPAELARNPALSGFVIDPGRTLTTVSRAATISLELQRRGASCHLDGDDPIADPLRTSARVITSPAERRGDGSPTVELLAQFSEELSRARTKGLVIDRFYRVAGDSDGFDLSAGIHKPAPAAGLTALLARARQWGPRIAELTASPVPSGAGDALEVRLTVLADEARRYLLVSNPSREKACRGTVTMPDHLGGRPVARAVEVAPASDRLPGTVAASRQGHITLTVDLRPGDALLFEIF